MSNIEIIPAINAPDFETIKKRLKAVEPFVTWVHLDVADGTFTPNTLWHNPQDLLGFETPLFLEVHLMIADMDIRFAEWMVSNVRRAIFHVEAAHDPEFVIVKIKEAGVEAGVAIRPETEWQKLEPWCAKADMVQFLAVPPGRAGQEFHPEIIEKVANIRRAHSSCIIEVDGGINSETGRKCAAAGANILVSANYIFNSPDIGKAIEDLKHATSY
ncbi:MAG: ribulose-phosphate 3-epimerase [Patescibacteria group bacterium]